MSGVTAVLTYEAETLRLPENLPFELAAKIRRLATRGDAEAQQELNRLLDRYAELHGHDKVANLVTDIGARFLLNTLYLGSGYTATWYVGLKDTGAVAAANIISSHSPWLELTGYSQATRPALTMATTSTGRSITNAASRATFNITSSLTIGGFFVVNNNTKGGTTGTLYSATNLGASRAVINGDIERLTITGTVP